MQQIWNKFIKKNQINDLSGIVMIRSPIKIDSLPEKLGDTLVLLPSIKNNIGNFRKLTHLEVTYIEEMLNIEELIEIIKVYDDCISMIVDSMK